MDLEGFGLIGKEKGEEELHSVRSRPPPRPRGGRFVSRCCDGRARCVYDRSLSPFRILLNLL